MYLTLILYRDTLKLTQLIYSNILSKYSNSNLGTIFILINFLNLKYLFDPLDIFIFYL